MSKVALFGSTGLLGSYIQQLNPEIHFVCFRGDIRDKDSVRSFLLAEGDASAVFHLAALVPKQVVDNDPKLAVEVNVEGTLNILEGIRGLGEKAPWLFYASTSHVYASNDKAIVEDSKLDPYTYYGLTKLQGEEWCNTFRKQYGLKIGIGRIFSYSDVKQSSEYFLPAMFKKIHNAENGENLLFSGVNGARDFLRVGQIDRAISMLAKIHFDGIVNIGTGKGTHLFSAIAEIAQILGREDLKLEAAPDQPTSHIAETTRLNGLGIDLKPEVNLLITDLSKNYLRQI